MSSEKPVLLKGSCHCENITYTCESYTPYPFMTCHCTADTKTCGVHTSNIMAEAATLVINCRDPSQHKVYRATYARLGVAPSADAAQDAADDATRSTHERHFCGLCSSMLWAFDRRWPAWIYPFATSIDSPRLPKVPANLQVHIFVNSRLEYAPGIDHVPAGNCFEGYPDIGGISDWHKKHGLYGTWDPSSSTV